MASLSIRKLDDKLYQDLQVLAAEHGVSMEEEVRQILYQTVYPQANVDIPKIFQKYFGPQGIDLDLDTHRKPHDPLDFSE